MNNIFRTQEGEIVVGQWLNAPIIVWFVAVILSRFPLSPFALEFLSLLSFGAFFTWAWLELFFGVNTFRRILGVLGLIGLFSLRLNVF